MTTYAKARRDFEYLEEVCWLDDQVDLEAERETLMQNPCKAQAASMYAIGVGLWFREHGEEYDDDPKVRAIRRHYESTGELS